MYVVNEILKNKTDEIKMSKNEGAKYFLHIRVQSKSQADLADLVIPNHSATHDI